MLTLKVFIITDSVILITTSFLVLLPDIETFEIMLIVEFQLRCLFLNLVWFLEYQIALKMFVMQDLIVVFLYYLFTTRKNAFYDF